MREGGGGSRDNRHQRTEGVTPLRPPSRPRLLPRWGQAPPPRNGSEGWSGLGGRRGGGGGVADDPPPPLAKSEGPPGQWRGRRARGCARTRPGPAGDQWDARKVTVLPAPPASGKSNGGGGG